MRVTLLKQPLSVLYVLCVIVLVMCMDVETNPGPDDQYNSIVQVIDWRFGQILHGLQLHTANINTMLNEKFNKLDSILSQLVSDVNRLKEFAQQGSDDIQNLQEDYGCILERLDTLEQTVDKTEAEMKLYNLKFFGIPEPSERYGTPCEDQILDILATFSNRVWNYSDIRKASRIGERRQHGEEPRPLIVQFHRWGDKMEILTDRELRDSLRREGIKVTSELTTKQRRTVDFYKQQGKTAFYRNGRLRIIDKNQYSARYPYSTDFDDGNVEERPHQSFKNWSYTYGDTEREHYGYRTDSRSSKREQARYDTPNHCHSRRNQFSDRDWTGADDDTHLYRQQRYGRYEKRGPSTSQSTRSANDRAPGRLTKEHFKDTHSYHPNGNHHEALPHGERYGSPGPRHRSSDTSTQRRVTTNNRQDTRDVQGHTEDGPGHRSSTVPVVPGHSTYSEAVASTASTDKNGKRNDHNRNRGRRKLSGDSAHSTASGRSGPPLQADTDPATHAPNNDKNCDTDSDIAITKVTSDKLSDRHTVDRPTEQRGDKTPVRESDSDNTGTEVQHTQDSTKDDRYTIPPRHDTDRMTPDTQHGDDSRAVAAEEMPESGGPAAKTGGTAADTSSKIQRQSTIDGSAEETRKNSDTDTGNPLPARSRATDRSRSATQARSVSRPARALRSVSSKAKALSQSNITDSFSKKHANEPTDTSVSADQSLGSVSSTPRNTTE